MMRTRIGSATLPAVRVTARTHKPYLSEAPRPGNRTADMGFFEVFMDVLELSALGRWN